MLEENKNKKILQILKANHSLVYLAAKITTFLIFVGILLMPSLLKELLTNTLMLGTILTFNVASAILIFFELLEKKQKSISLLINNYLFLTISIILSYGIFYYIDEKILEPGALLNVWKKEMSIEQEVFYFSGVTYFTIGYGDIVPAKPYAQIAALSEAMVGAIVNLIEIGLAIKKL
ncbi:MAG: ion channel [Candidatus Micrarchaeota archaeon]|nr:ion channel [Candidatus Micrarchaeota archaeon]